MEVYVNKTAQNGIKPVSKPNPAFPLVSFIESYMIFPIPHFFSPWKQRLMLPERSEQTFNNEECILEDGQFPFKTP